jgi:ubiquinone/menaquinone biosynthesis C-methylase UbiE
MRFIDHLKARQSRLPAGFWGKIAGRQMMRLNRKLIEWSLELLEIKPDDRILEIGFGPGFGIHEASKMASQGWVAGIELSETMLKEASKLNVAAIASGRVELRLGDASFLPYGDEEFDKVFAVNVLYFWENPLEPLAETKRVMRFGSRIVIGMIEKEDFKKEKSTQTGLFNLFSGQEVEQLLIDSGFSGATFVERDVHPVGMGVCAIANK